MKMMLAGLTVLTAWPASGQPATDRVFLEVPMLLDAPGRQQMIRAWHDGKQFFIDAAMLLEKLGFTVRSDQLQLAALDAARMIVLDFRLRQQVTPRKQALGKEAVYANGRFLLSVTGLERVFGPDIHFDVQRLVLRVSTAARLFDAGALHRRRSLWTEAPGPLKFRRQRSLWGGVMMNWQVHRQTGIVQASVELTGSILAGTLQGYVGTGRQALTYFYDRPQSTHLTRLEIGRFADGISGVRLSNRPLARRELQRVHVITGQARPYALVEAQISGQIIDQVQADARGQYQLKTPIRYGTNVVELRTRPLGGHQERYDRRYYLADHDLAEPGRFYYDVKVGRLPYGTTLNGEIHYGLAGALTVRVGADLDPNDAWLEAGGIWSPVSLMNVSTSVRLPARDYAANVQAWTRSFSFDGSWYSWGSGGSSVQLSIAGMRGPMSLNLAAHALRSPPFWQSQMINPSMWLATSSGLILRAMWQYKQSRYGKSVANRRHYWRVGAGAPVARAHAFLHVTGHDERSSLGLEGFLAVRGWSLGFAADVDTRSGRISGRLTVQANTPVASMIVRTHRRGPTIDHSQSLYGQVLLDHRVTLGPDTYQKSAARLIIFSDANSNGRQDSGEPLLPHIRAQLYNAHWSRDADGTLYASHLEPFGTYQVRILEASVRDPRLQPRTGYSFSFVADPGRIKRLYVPMQPMLQIPGRIVNPDRPPGRLRVQIAGGQAVPVYRDGGFTLVVSAGSHELVVTDVLTNETLSKHRVTVGAHTGAVTLNLNGTGK